MRNIQQTQPPRKSTGDGLSAALENVLRPELRLRADIKAASNVDDDLLSELEDAAKESPGLSSKDSKALVDTAQHLAAQGNELDRLGAKVDRVISRKLALAAASSPRRAAALRPVLVRPVARARAPRCVRRSPAESRTSDSDEGPPEPPRLDRFQRDVARRAYAASAGVGGAFDRTRRLSREVLELRYGSALLRGSP